MMNVCMYGKLCTIRHAYGTDRHKHALFARGYWQLLRVRVYTDTRFRPYGDECDRIPVCTNRARHTDSPSERRILNYGDKKMLRFFETIMYCINTCTALTRYLYVYVWIQIHVLAVR